VIRRREFIAGLAGTGVWPTAALAQQRVVPVIGYLTSGSERSSLVPSFHQGLGEQGYVGGRNVEVLARWANGQYDQLPALAADLVRRRVAVIFASADTGLVAKSATATIPIVFTSSTDPVDLGLVASLNRPGGNLTGVYFLIQTLTAKRLELLHEIVPAVASIGLLVNPTNIVVETQIGEAEAAARTLRVQLVSAKASTPSEIERAFAILGGQQIGALLVAGDALFFGQAAQFAALAARHGIPTIYPLREWVDAGGLMSYGPSISDAYRLAGNYVGRILKGDNLTDLPVQQSTRIEMVLNLKTARALGLAIPPAVLALADEVIE